MAILNKSRNQILGLRIERKASMMMRNLTRNKSIKNT